MNDTQTSTTALTDTPTTTKRTRSHFARRKEPQDVDVRNFWDGSDSGSADSRDSTDDDYTQDQEDQENDTTKESMKDTQTSTTALAGTLTTTKRTRSDFARCHDQDNDTTKETMKDTQTSTTAVAGTPTTTKRTRSDFARCHDQDNDTTKETMKDTQTSTTTLACTPTRTKRTRSYFARSQDQENDTTEDTLEDTQTSTMALAETPTRTNRTRSHFARSQDQQNDTTKVTMKDTSPTLTGPPTTTRRTRSHFARHQEPQDVDVRNFLDGSDSGNSADPRDSTDDDFTTDQRDSSDDDVTVSGRRSTNNNNKCVRRRYSICHKLWTIRKVEEKMQEKDMSLRQACDAVGVHHSLLVRWRKQKSRLMHIPNASVKSTHSGMASILKEHQEVLLRFIFELREQGIQVSLGMVALKASSLSRSFKKNAKEKIISRFVASHGLKHRMGTHESQRDPCETAAEALDYMQHVRVKLAQPNRHSDYSINMDQTPIPFTFNSKCTLEMVGKKTINIRKSTNDTKRATLALTVTASGKMIRPMLIFKGTANGRIVKRDMPGWDNTFLYACQSNAWMDERCMLLWVELCLKPHVATIPTGIIPIIFLDSYRCHMMASVVDAIQELGVEVEHIPGGCTCLCQPVDVGINKPFKKRIRDLWQTWMMGDMSQGTTTVTVSAPTRELIRDWCIDAYNQMQSETNIIKNAWRHGQYTWFAQNCALPPTNEVQLDNMATVRSDNEEEDDETLTEATVTENDQQPSPDSSVAIAQLVDESSLTDGNLTENDRQPSPGTSVALAQLLDESSDEEERADTAWLFGK